MNLTGLASGGGQTYVQGFVRGLTERAADDVCWRLLVTGSQRRLLPVDDLAIPTVEVRVLPASGPVVRTTREQLTLARGPLTSDANVLVGAGNFGRGRGQLPCVVVAHNALYFTQSVYGGAAGTRLRLESVLARANVRAAAATIVPSHTMGALVTRAGGIPVVAPLGPGLATKASVPASGPFVFLHRTGWGPHKQFGVLLKAVRLLAARRPGTFVVRSACDPRSSFAQRWPQGRADAQLLEDPMIAAHVECRGFPADQQDEATGHAAVVPSDLESFCFPLAEAVALRLPAIAADAPFARELCGGAAMYFAPRDEISLAAQMGRVLDGERPAAAPSDWRKRVSWPGHVETVAACCRRVGSTPGDGRG